MYSIWFSSFCQSRNSQAITKSILNLQHLMKPISLSAQRLLTSPSKVMNSKWQHPYLQTKDNPTSQLSEALMGQQRGWQRGCSGDSVTTGKTHKRIGSPHSPQDHARTHPGQACFTSVAQLWAGHSLPGASSDISRSKSLSCDLQILCPGANQVSSTVKQYLVHGVTGRLNDPPSYQWRSPADIQILAAVIRLF